MKTKKLISEKISQLCMRLLVYQLDLSDYS